MAVSSIEDGKSDRHVLFDVIDVATVQPTAVACDTGVAGLVATHFMTGGGGVHVSADCECFIGMENMSYMLSFEAAVADEAGDCVTDTVVL